MPFTEHPQRRQAVEEMHLRRFAPVAAPAELIQIVRLVDSTEREAEECGVAAAPTPMVRGSGGRHASGAAADGAQLIWERHSEASTATVILPGHTDGQDRLKGWIEGLPGRVVRATRIRVVEQEADAVEPLREAGFAADELVSCHIVGGVRLWSDFRLHKSGYGRLLLAANGVPPADLGRIIQRLQELGNYRNLALLGLPMAQAHMTRLNELEDSLAEHAHALTKPEDDDEALLHRLSSMSAELAHIGAEIGFRLGATNAYARIAVDRLDALEVRTITGHQSLADFTDRRLTPAVRTCATFQERLEEISERAARITALLRTRIETRIQRQNRDLLSSMEQSIGLQLRLQHVVEGLSVLAVGYYAIGLTAYLLKGITSVQHGFGPEAVLGVIVLPVLAAIYFFIRRQRVRLIPSPARTAAGSKWHG
jgi:uncharacterized membrane-anchored protein